MVIKNSGYFYYKYIVRVLIMKVTAKAHSNIALVKYWGKKPDSALNIPAVGSISITLNKLFTVSTVEFLKNLTEDQLILNGTLASSLELNRVTQFLDILRNGADIKHRAKIISDNNFPTEAGLASSASAFASLALAASKAAGLQLNESQLSELARKGSGSAARSVFGGFVEMKTGEKEDGSDSIAIPVQEQNYWDIWVVIAITSEAKKKIGSTSGMNHTANTSPFFSEWVKSSLKDLNEMRNAIQHQDFSKLGELSEFSCLKMHSVAMSANPGLIYWNKTTLECMHTIRELRENNIPVYFTIDAGPQVKVLCLKKEVAIVASELEKIDGVHRTISTGLGPGASIIEVSH
jgi:diphosphomevalonate decarboxylase